MAKIITRTLGEQDVTRDPANKRPIHLFLLLVSGVAALGYGIAFSMGDENRAGGVLIVQFAPLIAAFITKWTFDRSLRGLGWGWGKTRYQLAAYALPFLLTLVSYGLVWSLGFGGFYDHAFIDEASTEIGASFPLDLNSPYAVMLALVLLNTTIGLIFAFGGIGEELGWRGFLVPELYRHYTFTKTALISGVIWAVYHYPLVIVLMAPRLDISPWPMLFFLLIAGIGLSTIMAWLRLRSGSVWTAVIFHMVLNILNQGVFQNLTVKTSWLTSYISGEHGLMLALVSGLAGIWFWRKRDALPGRIDHRGT